MKQTHWTEQKDDHLKAHYHQKTATEIALDLNISKQSVLRRARKLGLARKTESGTAQRRKYSAEEDNYIQQNVQTYGVAQVASTLQRTEEAIRMRAKRLGIKITDPTVGLSPEQEQIVWENLTHKSYREIGDMIDKSAEAVRWHCRQRQWKKQRS